MTDFARPDSLWWQDPPPPFATLSSDQDADVLVIGGGITGITLAYTLASRDVGVVLVDAGWLAGAASGRNAGFLAAGPAEPYGELIALYGRGGAKAMVDIGRRSHLRVRALIDELGLACEYKASGSVRLARTEEEAEDQRASLPLLAEDGYRMREVPVDDVVGKDAARHFRAAFLDAQDGELHPVKFLHGVARGAERRGARLFEHSRVRSARWRDGQWVASLEGGQVRARTVVLATNASAPLDVPALDALIKPRRGQMLSTAPLGRRVIEHPTLAHWGYHYWRQTQDGRLVIGGWRDLDLDGEVGHEDQTTEKIQSAIERGLQQLVPEGATIERRWAGTMGFARDGRPLVGWLDAEHHLAIAAAYTGHGMGMAAACTEELADLLAFRTAKGIETFAPTRFAELAQASDRFLVVGS
jgi:glycine/D-amino acid oxidase-like deaminating enzyme